jgi:hypothetical protein
MMSSLGFIVDLTIGRPKEYDWFNLNTDPLEVLTRDLTPADRRKEFVVLFVVDHGGVMTLSNAGNDAKANRRMNTDRRQSHGHISTW